MKNFLIILSILFFSFSAFAEEIDVYFHDRPPYFKIQDDDISGITADSVKKIFQQVGFFPNWMEMPAKRQLKIIKNNEEAACAAGWFKNPEREKFAQFVGPIYKDLPTALLIRTDYMSKVMLKTVKQVLNDSQHMILLKDSYSYGPFIDELIANHSINKVYTSQDDMQMARLIASRRADMMFVSQEEGAYMLQSEFLSQFDLSLAKLKDMPEGNERFLMCSKQVPEHLIKRLNEGLSDAIAAN